MNSNPSITYEKSFELFKKSQKDLPEKIRWKLDYIAKIINGQHTQKTQNLPMEYQLQIEDLKEVNSKGLKVIFISIIQTLFNQQITIDKQCMIKKKGFFKSWTDAFIKYDDSYIYFNSANKTSRYRFKNIDIRLNSQSKRAFDFYHKNQQLMTVKFEKPQSMQAMYKTIKTLILKEMTRSDQEIIEQPNTVSIKNPNKSLLNISKKASQLQLLQKDNKISTRSQILNNEPKTSVNQQVRGEVENKRRMQFEKSIISQQQNAIIVRNIRNTSESTKELKLNGIPQNYLVKQSSRKMYIALHQKQLRLNLEIILNQSGDLKLNEIFSCLSLYKNWNSKVLKEQVSFQMKYEQKAIIYRVYERNSSILSKSRETYTMVQYKNLSPNSAILIEQSLDNQDKEVQYIRADLKTIFFIQTYNKTLKICIESEYDPKGFCSHTQAQQLLMSLYRDITHFENYLSQYSIKNYPNTQNLLFCEMQSECYSSEIQSSIIQQKCLVNQSEFQIDKSSDEDYQEQSKKALHIYSRSSMQNPFLQLKPSNPSKVPTLQYMELIRKKQFQIYYIKSSFNLKVLTRYQDYVPWYCLEELLKKGGEYEITQNLELKFINEKLIQSQKDILRFLIKQIGANLISGKSVLNVSLPVDIFQSRTLLQRSAASFGKCPDYLLRSCELKPLDQIMNVTAFIASVPTLELIMQKPFNPILGQTFQCYLKGIPLFYEQISHHPPISSYFMECPQFKLYGNLIAFADVGLNSGVGGNLGVMNIIFKNGYHYQCYFPPSEISGLIYGDRKFRCYGRGYIIQRSQSLFAQFSIEKQKKGLYETKEKLLPGSIIGGIYRVNKKFFQFLSTYKDNLKKFTGIAKEHIVEKLVHISGIWFDKIYMNQTLITERVRAYPVQYDAYSLPSDANFRLDVLYHKQNNLAQSQKEKQILQNIQREDRKLREKYEKSLKKR